MNNFFSSLLFLLSVFFIFPSHALIVPEKPQAATFVSDTVGLISNEDMEAIRQTSVQLYNDVSIPIVVVTINSLLNYTDGEYLGIEKYSKALFNEWKIGHSGHNYGVLLLISKDDRIARIQFGGSWGFLYDDHAQRIMNKVIVPHFKNKQYSVGIRAGVEELENLARTDLKFLMNLKTVLSVVFIFSFMAAFSTYLLIDNIGHKGWIYHLIYSGMTGCYFGAVYLAYSVGAINLVEFWLVFWLCSAVVFLSILVFAFFHANTHTVLQTVVHIIITLILVLFVPITILIAISLWFKSPYDDGSSDEGGGATGTW